MPEIETRADLAQRAVEMINDFNSLHDTDTIPRLRLATKLEQCSQNWQELLPDGDAGLEVVTMEALELFHDQRHRTTYEHCLALMIDLCDRIQELCGETD